MKIPCDTIARLSHLLPIEPTDTVFDHFRLDNGKVIASDRLFMGIESVEPFEGVFYIRADEALIEQCRTEAQWSSLIEFTPVPALQYTTAITTMGFKVAENIGIWPDGPTDYDVWRERVLDPVRETLAESRGPMVFYAGELERLARASPSGAIMLEQFVDPRNRPVVARDIDSPDWVGFFHARIEDGRHHVGATVPGWCK